MDGGNVRTFGTFGTGPGGFMHPSGVAVDGGGRIYVAEHDRVIRMDDLQGANWAEYRWPVFNTSPRAICLDRLGRIYVTDVGKVVRMDDVSGANYTEFSAFPFPAPGAFTGVWVDGADRIYVADGLYGRLYRMDDMAGTNLVSYGGPGTGLLGSAAAVCTDAAGRIYVLTGSGVVRMDDMTGTNRVTFSAAAAGAPFAEPHSLCVDAGSGLYVADTLNRRVVHVPDVTGGAADSLAAGSLAEPYGIALW